MTMLPMTTATVSLPFKRRMGCGKIVLLSLLPLMMNQLVPVLWTNRFVVLRELDVIHHGKEDDGVPLIKLDTRVLPTTLVRVQQRQRQKEPVWIVKPKPLVVFLEGNDQEDDDNDDQVQEREDATVSTNTNGNDYRPPLTKKQVKILTGQGHLKPESNPNSYQTEETTISSSRFELPGLREPYKYPQVKGLCEGKGPDCVIPQLWLSTTNISACNSIHEIDLVHQRIVAKGGKRVVWKLSRPLVSSFNSTHDAPSKFGTTYQAVQYRKKRYPRVKLFRVQPPSSAPQEVVALKMFHYRRDKPDDFGPQTVEYQRRDAVISQLMSSSPHIVNIYGYCGASALYDFADGGNLQDNILGSPKPNNKQKTSEGSGPLQGEELLEVAHSIVASVADLHVANPNTLEPVIAHADIYGPQWVNVRGQYQLTDFNLAKLLVRDKSQNKMFPFTRDVVDNWFAPEVHRQRNITHPIVTYQMDIYNMGNILFMILVGRPPFGTKKRWDVHKLIMSGKQIMDEIPDKIRDSKDYAQRVLVEAIDMCRQEDPEQRPSAKDVAKFMKRALKLRDKYGSVDAMNQRRERFPSIKERIKLYMSSWYAPPCVSGEGSDSSSNSPYIQYQYVPASNSSSPKSCLLRIPPTTQMKKHHPSWKRLVQLEGQIRTDDAMVLVPEQFDQNNTDFGSYLNSSLSHAGFRYDIVTTLLPHVELLHGKPILTQWGDKKSLVISSLQQGVTTNNRPNATMSSAMVSFPHLKKCRRALTKKELQQATAETCYSSDHRPRPGSAIVWKLDSNRLLGWIPFVEKKDIPWNEKETKAVFRGRLTGQAWAADGQTVVYRPEVSEVEYCQAIKRCNFVLQYHNSTTVDARLISLQSKNLSTTVEGVPLLGEKLEMKDFLKHKVLILMEGNDVSSGLGWSLRSKSVVMMPPPTMTSWLMEELLEPWVHYIPLNENLDDVEEKMTWVKENDAEAEQIALNGRLWMLDLLEHPDAMSDDEGIFRGMLERYARFFVPSSRLQKVYQKHHGPL